MQPILPRLLSAQYRSEARNMFDFIIEIELGRADESETAQRTNRCRSEVLVRLSITFQVVAVEFIDNSCCSIFYFLSSLRFNSKYSRLSYATIRLQNISLTNKCQGTHLIFTSCSFIKQFAEVLRFVISWSAFLTCSSNVSRVDCN
jgi:hypothetical protein